MPAELIAPALACGNAVVWTPAPSTSVAAIALAECVAEADLPPGVFNLVTGPGARRRRRDRAEPGTHAIGFIGSTATGRKVAEAAAGKPLRARARRQRAAGGDGRRRRRGGRRGCDRRVLPVRRPELHRRRAAARARRRQGRVRRARRRAGGGARGARRSLRGRDDARPAEQRAGRGEDGRARRGRGRARRDGRRGRSARGGFPTGLYWPATILDGVPADSLVAREETFGPIAPVVEIGSLDEAIGLANASPYGLLAAIFTRDLAQGLRFADEVRTGWVNVNESTNYWESHLPFGGRSGSASGTGRVGGSAPMESFTELQTVVLTA